MNVLWVSRHAPGEAEEIELRRIYGPVTEVIKYSTKVLAVNDIVLAAQKYECSVVCALLPIKVNQRLLPALKSVKVTLIRPVYHHRDIYGNVARNNEAKFVGFEELREISIDSVRIGEWAGEGEGKTGFHIDMTGVNVADQHS